LFDNVGRVDVILVNRLFVFDDVPSFLMTKNSSGSSGPRTATPGSAKLANPSFEWSCAVNVLE